MKCECLVLHSVFLQQIFRLLSCHRALHRLSPQPASCTIQTFLPAGHCEQCAEQSAVALLPRSRMCWEAESQQWIEDDCDNCSDRAVQVSLRVHSGRK